jgi:hypothetical protein
MRRERQMDEALRTSSQHREFATQVQNVMQPYSHMLQAENTDPIRAIGALMQTAAALRTAPPMQKAALVADLIVQHGIDPAMLDDHLSARYRGRGGPADPMAPIMQMLDQRLQPVTQFMTSLQQRQQSTAQQVEQEATTALEEFMNDPQNEFVPDVAQDMADLMELAAKRGQKLSLQEAYKRATMAHPTIAEIVSRRALQSSAAQQTSAAQKARQAAASVTDSGAPSQGDPAAVSGVNMRSDIMSSIQALSERR